MLAKIPKAKTAKVPPDPPLERWIKSIYLLPAFLARFYHEASKLFSFLHVRDILEDEPWLCAGGAKVQEPHPFARFRL